VPLRVELKKIFHHPTAFGTVLLFLLGTLSLINNATEWSDRYELFWSVAFAIAALFFVLSVVSRSLSNRDEETEDLTGITEGPMFGALMEMVQRPHFAPVIIFILIFKLADSSMGFMIKPFWVDVGFTATQIGLVSVNIGLVLSIAGGIVGGWITDRTGIFKSLWLLGLFQAISNLGYAFVATVLPTGVENVVLPFSAKTMMYSASAIESFTGGLGTAAFLAFLMAIVNKQRSATEYALLSSVFALSRSVAGWAGGFGAELLGYGPYFLLTFFLAFPAYLLLPWVKKMMVYASSQEGWGQN